MSYVYEYLIFPLRLIFTDINTFISRHKLTDDEADNLFTNW